VSDKLLNMSLACLLLAGDPARKLWIEAGAGMIAVDTLVHNWMHRSGILKRLRSEHPYGAACYGPTGAPRLSKQQQNRSMPGISIRHSRRSFLGSCKMESGGIVLVSSSTAATAIRSTIELPEKRVQGSFYFGLATAVISLGCFIWGSWSFIELARVSAKPAWCRLPTGLPPKTPTR